MEELESQVAKIHLGSPKSVTSFVSVTAEKAPLGHAELYVISEFPFLNPAARDSCEKISLAIAAALKRAYKKTHMSGMFENAVAQINEELGKLAALGQDHWIDKLNCIIAVKEGNEFHITTCGKVAAFLFRSGEFTDISCSTKSTHPLKTFENIASGKIKLGDLLILSTTQLFNYLSMDRFKNILSGANFLTASQTIIQMLKENAGPEVAFGTILNLQVEIGQTAPDEVDLEEFILDSERQPNPIVTHAKNFLRSLFMKKEGRKPQVELPNITFSEKLKHLAIGAWQAAKRKESYKNISPAHIANTAKLAGSGIAGSFQRARQGLQLHNFQAFSLQKKILMISVLVMFVALVVNLAVAKRMNRAKEYTEKYTAMLTETKQLLDKANNSLLYRDDTNAKEFLAQASASLPSFADVPEDQTETFRSIEQGIAELKERMDKSTPVQALNLGGLGQSEQLLRLGKYLAVLVNGTVISYNKDNSQFQDGFLKSPEDIIRSAPLKASQTVIYNGASLFVWDYEKGTAGQGFSLNVPQLGSMAGLAYYPVNSRIYTINKSTNQILNFLVTGNAISKPVVWTNNANDLGNSIDIAVDGSVYILNSNGITKYHAGRPAEFDFPKLFTPFSGRGKIFTDTEAKNIYVLDSGTNHILMMDKKGNLLATFTSKQFTQLTDFQVDEKNKTMWLLNDGSLLKVTLP